MKRQTRELDYVIGANIRYYRELSGLTQKSLADCLGVTFQQIQKYENGVNRVSAVRLWEVAKILRKDIGVFYRKPKTSD